MAISITSANKFTFPITCNTNNINNNEGKRLKNKLPPIFISTNPSQINIDTLCNLYLSCNHSPHRFPLLSDGIDTRKLGVAVSNSSVVVSVFAEVGGGSVGVDDVEEREKGLWGRILPTVVTPENGELVGFGRAVSDLGLTASIYDVMVIPSLRRLGIGRMIVQRILRILTNKGIYDISALCSEEERLFFVACGFGDDALGSTTMMYTNTASSNSDNEQIITRAVLLLSCSEISMMKQSGSSSMGKIWVEVCLISARGLPRSSLWKYQWYAVGWIDPNNKYCTKIDASGNANPVWKTKFTSVIDPSESEFQDMALHVEVYSREPVFLREKHQGSATVILKEFLAKHCKNSEGSNQGNEDVGSFQLRKKNSNKPQGFIDVSIRISEVKEGTSSHFFLGNEDGFNLRDSSSNFNMASNGVPYQAQPAGHAELPFDQLGNPRPPVTIRNRPYNHPMPHQTNHSNPAVAGPSYPPASSSNYPTNYSNPHVGRPSYPPTRTPGYPPPPPHAPPPLPPSSHTGYVPTFLPRTNDPSTSYINMPSSGAGRGVGPGFGVGLGAGALAAGAVIFGDDIMSGFDLPTAGIRDATFAFATDPPS